MPLFISDEWQAIIVPACQNIKQK